MEFFIGIETEGLWNGKAGLGLPPAAPESKPFAKALVSLYNAKIGDKLLRADFDHGSHPGHYDSPEGKDTWIVATDFAIGKRSLNHSFGGGEGHALEFVSPKLTFGPHSEWREGVKKHWATLLQIGEIEVDDMCATHVHISPLEEKVWSLRQLKQVAKAVIYFEEAFKVISAPSRRHHDFTETYKGIHDPQEFPQFAEYRQSIQRCTNNLQLIDVMQPNGRDYPWNFENTDVKFASRDAKSIETIEFRRAPGVTSAAHCLIWVELSVSFVQAAAQYDIEDVCEHYQSNVKGLKNFMLKAGVPNMNESDLLDIVFYAHENELEVNTDEGMEAIFEQRLKELRISKPESWRPWAESSS